MNVEWIVWFSIFATVWVALFAVVEGVLATRRIRGTDLPLTPTLPPARVDRRTLRPSPGAPP